MSTDKEITPLPTRWDFKLTWLERETTFFRNWSIGVKKWQKTLLVESQFNEDEEITKIISDIASNLSVDKDINKLLLEQEYKKIVNVEYKKDFLNEVKKFIDGLQPTKFLLIDRNTRKQEKYLVELTNSSWDFLYTIINFVPLPNGSNEKEKQPYIDFSHIKLYMNNWVEERYISAPFSYRIDHQTYNIKRVVEKKESGFLFSKTIEEVENYVKDIHSSPVSISFKKEKFFENFYDLRKNFLLMLNEWEELFFLNKSNSWEEYDVQSAYMLFECFATSKETDNIVSKTWNKSTLLYHYNPKEVDWSVSTNLVDDNTIKRLYCKIKEEFRQTILKERVVEWFKEESEMMENQPIILKKMKKTFIDADWENTIYQTGKLLQKAEELKAIQVEIERIRANALNK